MEQKERDGESEGPESQGMGDGNGRGATRLGTKGQTDRDRQTGVEQRTRGTGRWETDTEQRGTGN